MAARSTPKVLRHKAQGRAAFRAALPWELDTVPNYSERVAYSRNCRVDRTTVTYPGLAAKSAVNPGLWDVTPSALKFLDMPDSFPGVPNITRTRLPTVSRVSHSERKAGRTAVIIGVGVAIGIGFGLFIRETQIDRFQKPTPIATPTPTPNFLRFVLEFSNNGSLRNAFLIVQTILPK